MDERNLNGESGLPAEDAGVRDGEDTARLQENAQVEVQLARIRAMDPEMTDLGAILRSEAGEKFRQYVDLGLDFVDAYSLAARERLGELRDKRTAEQLRTRNAGKGHLSATSTRGQGGVSVPAGELAIIRALLPDATDEEIRRYYNQDRKRFKR